MAVSNTSDRHVDSGIDQPPGVSDGQVLHSAVQVMGQTVQRRDDGGRIQDWESLAAQYAKRLRLGRWSKRNLQNFAVKLTLHFSQTLLAPA